uniref:AT-rich interactive domain-containing protein 4B n=1 Tax=Cacopsylla melanoneura TaxID=428564 RepID=A0A8D8QB75_9HEMI
MSSREVKKEKMGDDPPYLAVGTDVSAKYKGAFCEAKVRKVVRVVKCKVQLKYGGVAFVTDDQIKGSLRIGSTVEVKLPDKKDFVEASISNIKDLSQYTVVFDDGDITTLRRTALCLKSGRHFAESETLDQLPLTHPEHFSTPVMGASRRGRRGRGGNEDSSDDEDPIGRGGERQREVDIGKVVCVEVSEKKKTRDNWFPGLIVAPNAQDAVRIDVDEDYLVRSFKDGRYFTVPKKEATEFTRERGLKVDNPSLKLAVEKALQFLDKDELPPHWDRDLMFGLVDTDLEEDSDQMDSDSSDDEPREEKDHFVAQLYKFMDDRGTPINKGPVIQSRDVDLYRLFRVVHKLGGYNRVTNQNQWKLVTHKMGFGQSMSTVNNVKHAYKKFLHSFEDFYRKLGCTMVNHPRGNRRSNKSNRSLIRDKDRATPVQKESDRIRAEPGGSGVKTNTPGQKDADSSRGVKSESSIGNVEAHRDAPAASEVKVEVKREDPEEPPSQSSAKKDQKTKEFEAKRERHVKEEAMRREKTRDKTASAAAASKDPPPPPPPVCKEESFIPVTKKKLEDTYARVKSDEKPKSSIGILAKFSYKKDKEKRAPDGSEVKDKDRLNRVKKSLSKGSGGLMERQKRTIKETVKAFAKTLGFGGKGGGAGGVSGGGAAAGASVSGGGGTRKMSASTTTSGSGEEEERKKKDDGPGVEKKRISSGSRREDLALTTTPPPPTRKSSCSGGEEGKSSGRSNSRNKARKPEDEGSSDTGGPGCISPGDAGDGGPLEIVSPHKCISVGDKLKVYYGPNHKSKVTYEAKVLQTREEDGAEREYLVHYTGWNTRYDEWIRRNRIAENLSWTPARSSKRIGSKVEAAAPQPGSSPATATPTTPSVQRSLETPSSGAMMKGKLTPRRSSTRTSTRSARANTDDSEESDKDSGSESETETESGGSPVNRSMRSRRILSDEDKKPPSLSSPSPGGSKTRSSRKCKTEDEEEEDKEKQQEPEEVKTPTHSTPTHSQEESRKSLRLSARKKQEAEHDKRLGPESDSDSETETERMTDDGMKAKVLEIIEPLDDVYEFKEPEPFNFKQKKTISPPSGPATAGKAPKKNIGLFEDYDNLEEDSEDPISAAIQRVMDTCSETQGEDMDLLDSNSGDSDISNDSSTMCEMMKKRLQSEINTYEGPKSKMKSGTRGGDSGTPSMRTRRSSESKSTSKAMSSDEKTKTQQRNRTEKTSSESNEKLNETVKPDTDPGTAGKVKKPDVESSSKSKKTETDTSGSSRTKKSDVESNTSGKTKKSDDTTPTSSKTSKKPSEQEKETPETSSSMKPRKLETPEGSMKTRLNRTEGNSSPGSKTRSKTEQLREEAEDMDEGKRPGASLVRTKTALSDSKGKTVLSFKKTVETAAVDHLKTSSLANKMVPDSAKVLEPKVLTFTSMSKVTQSENESTPTALSKMSSVHSIDKSKKDLSVSKVKSKLIPMASPSMVDVMKSSKSSTDFSAQTEPHVLGEKDKPVNIPSPSLLYPKLQKIECEPSTLVETKSTDIPVLQRIECVLPKTPIKRDVIDPSKIDLIKISPNMPQLEKIDTLDAGTVEKKDPTAGIAAAATTPGKAAESGETHREDLKFPSFKFDDVTETPEKVFTPAIDTETSSPIRIDKIEFKMKPKAPSPLGFGKTSTRKLVRQRIDEVKATTSAVVAKEKKSPQPQPQPIVKKYGPSSNMSVSDSTGSRVENQDTKDKLATVSFTLSPKQTVEGGSPVTLISKNKESTPTSSNKPNESPTTSILGKIKEIPSSVLSKNKDNTPTLSSKAKDSPALVSNKAKDIPSTSISSRKDVPSVLNKIKDTTTPVSSKSRENPSSNVSNKCKDISAPVSSKIKETPTPPSSKIKDTPTSVANKIKEVASTPVSSKIKESPVLKQMKVILTPASSKVKDPSTPLSQKIRDVASPVSAKIKDTPVLNKSKDSSIDTSTIRENAPTDTSTVKFLLIGQIKENSSISLKGKEISPSPSLVGNKTKDATPTKSKGSTMMLLNLRKDTSALVGLSKNKDTAPNVAAKAKDTLSILPSKKQDTTMFTPKPKNNKDSLLPSTSRQSESPTKDSARIGQSPPTLSETNKQTRCENESDEKSIDKASVESSTKVSEDSSTKATVVSSSKASVEPSTTPSMESSTKVSQESSTKPSMESSTNYYPSDLLLTTTLLPIRNPERLASSFSFSLRFPV